jgi:hypothetical protein
MVETLSKFGVPINGARTGQFQPKIRHRFRVRVVNFGPIAGGLELTNNVVSADRPNVTFAQVEIQSYNSRMYYASKPEFQTISILLRDDITNTVSKLVGHQVQKQQNFFEQTSAAAGINYKFTTYLEILDGGNETVFETWTLEGCFLQEANWNQANLDYTSSDPLEINLTVRFDNATLGDGLFELNPQLKGGVTIG